MLPYTPFFPCVPTHAAFVEREAREAKNCESFCRMNTLALIDMYVVTEHSRVNDKKITLWINLLGRRERESAWRKEKGWDEEEAFERIAMTSQSSERKIILHERSNTIGIIAEILFILCLINKTRTSFWNLGEEIIFYVVEIKYSISTTVCVHAKGMKWDFYALYTLQMSHSISALEIERHKQCITVERRTLETPF